MKYPILSNWITYKRIPERDEYYVKNYILDQECVISASEMKFAKRLDGKTRPSSINDNRNSSEKMSLIKKLDKLGVIRTDHGLLIGSGGASVLKMLFRTRNNKAKQKIAKCFNTILLLLFMPILLAGIYVYLFVDSCQNINPLSVEQHIIFEVLIYFSSIVAGGALHEICHAVACRAYGGLVFEYGIRISLLPGLYTLLDFSNVKPVLKKIQILLAGIEGNIVLAGGLLLLSGILPEFKSVLFSGSMINLILSLINLSFFKGTDGLKILLLIIGVANEDESNRLPLMTRGRRKKKIIKCEGLLGYIKLFACHMIVVLQRMYPILIIIDIIAIIGVFHEI